ncbi:MAG: hypothetical protein ACYST3_00220 [Planctomycetota bacterium]
MGGGDLISHLQSEDKNYAKLKHLVKVWTDASNSFITNNGDGIVVGVLWGGWGAVHMDLTSTSSQDQWKYGGQGEFSYSDIGESVSVKATYDGSQSDSKSEVEVNCTSDTNGSCIKEIVDKWFEEVKNKLFSDIADISLMDKAPSISGAVNPANIPDFKKPKEDKGVSAKIGEIKGLGGLKAYAQAAAYDKAMKDDPKLSLSDFLKKSEEQADISGLDRLKRDVENNAIDVLKEKVNTEQLTSASTIKELDTEANNNPYVPLGIWISDWSKLFPWLTTGFNNNVGDDEQSLILLKARTMIQDLLTLSRLYYGINQAGVNLAVPGTGEVNVKQIADSFANDNAIGKLSDKNNALNVSQIKSAISDTYFSLSPHAKAIYKKWNEVQFLCDCELGMGIIDKNGQSISSILPIILNIPGQVSLSPCDYSSASKNYSAFSSFYKGYPVITPRECILKGSIEGHLLR